MAYIYNADIYCDCCGEDIKKRLAKEIPNFNAANYDDERQYDSDEYPKYYDDSCEADCPQHCGSGADCLDYTEIGGERYGHFLENDLTTDGVQYVQEKIDEGGAVAEFWAAHYRAAGYDISTVTEQLADCLESLLQKVDTDAPVDSDKLRKAIAAGWKALDRFESVS